MVLNKGGLTMLKKLLTKEDFMEKYHLKDSKYSDRMQEMRSEPDFEQGYIAPTHREVWIDEVVYQEYLVFLSNKRKKELLTQ